MADTEADSNYSSGIDSGNSSGRGLRTLVLGASAHAYRYSFRAANQLLAHGHEIVLIGAREDEVSGHPIYPGTGDLSFVGEVHTVTVYLAPHHQDMYADALLELKPERVIFNPGSENRRLEERLSHAGIAVEEACTLVLLSNGLYERA